jgi:uncharacterized MAPEG superfamily protein
MGFVAVHSDPVFAVSLSSFVGSGALTFLAVPLAYGTAIHAKFLGMQVFRKRVGYVENVEPRRMAENAKLTPEEAGQIRRALAAQDNGMEAILPLSAGVCLCVATQSPLWQTDAIVAAFLAARVAYNYQYVRAARARDGNVRSLIWTGGIVLSLSLFAIALSNHK